MHKGSIVKANGDWTTELIPGLVVVMVQLLRMLEKIKGVKQWPCLFVDVHMCVFESCEE